MLRSLLVIIILWIISYVYSDLNSQKAGPYEIVDVSLAHCDDEGTKELSYSLKIRKISRKAIAFSMNATIVNYTINNDLNIYVIMDQFSNGGWKEGYFVKKWEHFCDTIKFLSPDFDKLLRAKLNRGCPLPPGNYSIMNASLGNFTIKNIPVFFYNKYRVNCYIMTKDDKKIGCFRLNAEFIPKRKRKS